MTWQRMQAEGRAKVDALAVLSSPIPNHLAGVLTLSLHDGPLRALQEVATPLPQLLQLRQPSPGEQQPYLSALAAQARTPPR